MLAEDPAVASRCLVITGASPGPLPDGVAFLAKPFGPGQLLAAVQALHQPATSAPSSQRPRASGLSPPPGAGPPAPRTPEAAWPHPPAAAPPRPRAPEAARPTSPPDAGPPRPRAPEAARPTSPPDADPPRPRGPEAAWPTPASGAVLPSPPAPGRAGPPPAAGPGTGWQLLRLLHGLRARDRDNLADLLHDGPVQDLTAAVLSLQMMRGAAPGGDAGQLDAVREQLDATSGVLRWLMDARLPLPPPGTRLAAALRQQTAWLATTPVTVDIGGLPDTSDAATVAALADVAELVLAALLAGGHAARAHIALSGEDCVAWAEVDSAGTGDGAAASDAAAQAALDELTSALGSTAWTDFRGQHRWARVALPSWLGLGAQRPVTDP